MEKHTPKLVLLDILWRPSVAGIGTGIAILPVLTWLRDEFLSKETAERWKIPKLLPHWPWWVWVIVVLSVLLLTILKASNDVIKKYEIQAESEVLQTQQALREEIEKRGRPELMASFQMIMGERPQWWLYLKNSSSPAVNVHVRDIRNGSKVLRFENPGPVHGTAPTGVRCHILENGIQERFNVMAIFDGQQFYGQSSPSLVLKVVYSSLDSKATQKSWELSVAFWYDRLYNKLEMGQQSIESI
jgi:hypothetical protein